MPRFAHFVPHFEVLSSMKSRLFVFVEENRNTPRSRGCPNDQLLAEKTSSTRSIQTILLDHCQLLESSNLKTTLCYLTQPDIHFS